MYEIGGRISKKIEQKFWGSTRTSLIRESLLNIEITMYPLAKMAN